jgi:hypothetical protein
VYVYVYVYIHTYIHNIGDFTVPNMDLVIFLKKTLFS